MASARVLSPPNGRSSFTNTKARTPEDESKGIWSSMLDSVATGKRLVEKTIVVLGGNPNSQKDFLEAISQDNPQQRTRRLDRSHNRKPLIANKFALGYTYQDILDPDHDDVLARLSMHFLSSPHPSFAPLLTPLFAPESVPDTLLIILLSWNEPWAWMSQLRAWIRVIRSALARADNDTKIAMDENMKAWTERRKGNVSVAASDSQTPATDTSSGGEGPRLPGPGEWDEPLGVPLCVVCQYAEETETFSSNHGWKDETHFDVVLQHLRTVLLKHGASLVYTASAAPGQLPTLLRSSLDIMSLLGKEDLRYNIIEREKICIPPGWDSWGKIKGMNENFDCEGVSKAWSVDIDAAPEIPEEDRGIKEEEQETKTQQNGTEDPSKTPTSPKSPDLNSTAANPSTSALTSYSSAIPNPHADTSAALTLGSQKDASTRVTCPPNQEFLASQLQVLEKLKAEDEADAAAQKAQGKSGTGQPARRAGAAATTGSASLAAAGAPATPGRDGEGRQMENMIGPVQFNVGGIQVDADEMLKSLQSRQGMGTGSNSTPVAKEKDAGAAAAVSTPVAQKDTPNSKMENEKLASFFAGLMSRGSGSATNSPK